MFPHIETPLVCLFVFHHQRVSIKDQANIVHQTYLENIKVIKDNNQKMASKEQAGGHPIYFGG